MEINFAGTTAIAEGVWSSYIVDKLSKLVMTTQVKGDVPTETIT